MPDEPIRDHPDAAAERPSGDAVPTLLRVLDIADPGTRTTEEIYTGISHPMPHGRIFGGQVLAQAVVAGTRSVHADRPIHSMHGYFLRPGSTSAGLTLAVDRIHDGRSFSRRRVQAYQRGVPIFSMIASFQTADSGLEHAEPMPEGVPAPETLPSRVESMTAGFGRGQRPVDIRHVDGDLAAATGPSSRQAVWVRVSDRLPDDPLLHRAALAYLSDMTIQEPILRARSLSWGTPGLRVASLDHAMWWHRPARADEWLLYVEDAPSAQGGRGLSLGRMYTRDGALAASVAQEIMVRVPEDDAPE